MFRSERKPRKCASTLFAVVSLLLSLAGIADERILNYDSVVDIRPDGSLFVVETIEVRAEGEQIRRGIYRDFPTDYRDGLGNRYKVKFDVHSVQRNGGPESWHTEKRSNGVRVYFGSASHFLQPGVYRYRFEYRTTRQLGFFEQHDELYWNVTGLGWMFPIDSATATIRLPETVAAESLVTDFYTGAYGSTSKDARVSMIDGRTLRFETTRTLPPKNGLTVVTGFPKGLVPEPDFAMRTGWFLADNAAGIALLAGILAPLLWYLWSWNQHGRDPRPGTIIPRFKPPTGLSPAGSRYVSKMSFDNKTFTAAVVSLAVKGWLNIIENDGDFSLERLSDRRRQKPLTKGEQAVMDALLPNNGHRIELDNDNHSQFQKARLALGQALKQEHKGRLFQLNGIFTVPALIMTVLAAVVAIFLPGSPVMWIFYAIASIILHITFLRLLRAPTIMGRAVMDEIEGLKMYLDTAEQDRLDRMRSPKLTPEVFETFLPFAFALGVENNWCERFSRELPEMTAQGGSGSYNPNWYRGHQRGLNSLNHLGSKFGGQLSSAISSASTPPGSSSGGGGGGGGGFSGGGGGGGGGGGW